MSFKLLHHFYLSFYSYFIERHERNSIVLRLFLHFRIHSNQTLWGLTRRKSFQGWLLHELKGKSNPGVHVSNIHFWCYSYGWSPQSEAWAKAPNSADSFDGKICIAVNGNNAEDGRYGLGSSGYSHLFVKFELKVSCLGLCKARSSHH